MLAQVYCPHTAIDAAPGGLGDWLADIVTGTPAPAIEAEEGKEEPRKDTKESETPKPTPQIEQDDPFLEHKRPVYMLQHHPSQLSIKDTALNLSSNQHTRRPIEASKVKGYEKTNAGMGRIVRFNRPQPLLDIIDRIGLGLGNPKGFPIAVPQGKQASDMMISSVAICAGSGGHLFSGLGKNGEEDVDLLFTGELSHHEALAAIEQGKCVITLFHSNTERGFLHSVLKPQLEKQVRKEVSSFPLRSTVQKVLMSASGMYFVKKRAPDLVLVKTTSKRWMTSMSRYRSARWIGIRMVS